MSDETTELTGNHYMVGVMSETSYGEDPWAGADPDDWMAFRSFEPDPQIETVDDEGQTATHSGRPHDAYGDHTTLSWECAVRGILNPETTPELPIGALLKASNFEETIDTEAPSFEYQPITGDTMARAPSVAYAFYDLERGRENARKRLFLGVRQNLTLTASMGDPLLLSGDAQGLYTKWPESTVDKPADPSSYDGTKNRFIMVGATVTLDNSHEVSLESWELSTNWSLEQDREGTSPDSPVTRIWLSRDKTSRMETSQTLKGRSTTLQEILPEIKAAKVFTFESVFENSNGDRLTIEAPAMQFGNASEGRDTSVTFDTPGFLNGTGAGENDVTLTFDRSE